MKDSCFLAAKEVLYRQNVRAAVPLDLLTGAFKELLFEEGNDAARDVLLSSFLTTQMLLGPNEEKVVALLKVAFSLDKYDPLILPKIKIPGNKPLIASAGSGKKGVKTINISTPAAIIAAAAGVRVLKLGSFATSSVTGSADLMGLLGIPMQLTAQDIERAVLRSGFAFCGIEGIVPRFDRLYGGRFFAPHILSFALAALLSKVAYDKILFGLAHPDIEISLKTLREFNIENAIVVTSSDDDIHYLDEIGVYGTTKLIGMQNGAIGRTLYFQPTDMLGLPHYKAADLKSFDADGNARAALNVLNGKGTGAHEDIVCINAANLIYLAGQAEDLCEGFSMAKHTVKSGKAIQKLEEYCVVAGGDLSKIKAYC